MDLTPTLKFLQKALPWIGAAATGNVPALVGLAAGAVSDAVGQKIDPSAEAIATAVASASPEQLLELKKADDELKLKAQQLGFENTQELRKLDVQEEQIYVGDAASARGAFSKDRGVFFLGLVVLAMSGVLTCAILYGVYEMITGGLKLTDAGIAASIFTLLGMIIREIDSRAQQVLNFFYGSSHGSRNNQAAMAQAVSNIGTAVPTGK